MAIKSTVVTDTETLIYQSRDCSAVTTIYFCNASEQDVFFNVHVVPAGSQANFTNLIYTQLLLPCRDTYVLDTEKIVLENNDAIYARVIVPTGSVIGDLVLIATVSAIIV